MRTHERQAGARQPATLRPEGAERGDGVSGPGEGGEGVRSSGGREMRRLAGAVGPSPPCPALRLRRKTCVALLSSSFWLNFNQGEVVLRNPEVTLKSTGPTLNSSCSLPGDSCSRHPATGTFTHGVAASSETQARSFTPGHLQCPGGHCTHPFSFTLSQICLLLSI